MTRFADNIDEEILKRSQIQDTGHAHTTQHTLFPVLLGCASRFGRTS